MPSTQDTSRQTKTRPQRRKIDPVVADLRDLTAYLATDTEAGLSPKEAEKRLLRREVKALFAADKPKWSSAIVPLLREPVMWLLLVVCVVACIFDRGDIGFYSILLWLFHGVVCLLMSRATGRLEERMQAYDIPLTRVIRNRSPLRVPADQIVPGDIILLREGDVVPADARLLTCYDMVVAEDTLEGDASLRETLYLEKDAREIPNTRPHKHSPAHMVYAGGLVMRGRGKALAVATGGRTHMGGLMGKIDPSHQDAPPQPLAKARKQMSTVNLIVAVVSLPLTAIGILTLGDRYHLLDLFATALALSVLTLTEHIFVMGAYLSTSLRQASVSHPDPHLSCEIRNTETLEKLRHMDHLILVGTSALHDGVFMPESILTCDTTYTCGQSATDLPLVCFAEKMALWAEGLRSNGVSYGEAAYIATQKITQWAQPDEEGLMLRLSSLTYERGGVEVVMKHSTPTHLKLTAFAWDDPVFDTCMYVRCASQDETTPTMSPMDQNTIDTWLTWVKSAETQGKRVFVLVSETQGETCAEGLIAYEPETCPKTKGCLSTMMTAGIDVTVFLRDVVRENTYYLRREGILSGREVPHLLGRETAQDLLNLTSQGVKAFEGCVTKDILDYITALQEKGCVVGVLSVEREDQAVLAAADIAMTCAPVEIKEALAKQQPARVDQAMLADGGSDSQNATDICRYTADVVVRRVSQHGGGVCGVRQALLTAEQMEKSTEGVARYILLSQILRGVMVLLPLLMGLTILSAPVILFSGFVMDLVAYWCFAKADLPTELTSRRMEKAMAEKEKSQNTPKTLWDKLPVPLYMLIATAVSALIPWVAALVAKLLHVDFGADLGYFGMLCLIATQAALLLTEKRPRRRRLGFFLTVGMVCIYVGGLSIALAAGLAVLWCLILPLVQPLCLFVAVKVYQKVSQR